MEGGVASGVGGTEQVSKRKLPVWREDWGWGWGVRLLGRLSSEGE